MRKYLVLLYCALALALVSSMLGVAIMALGSGSEARRASSEDAWSLGPVAVRGPEDYRRAADGFRERYRWLVPGDSESQVADAEEAMSSAPPPPPTPRWHFVGVLLEGADSFALVEESGQVVRYKAGDAFQDGTMLLAVSEQSVRVMEDGKERDLHLYLKN